MKDGSRLIGGNVAEFIKSQTEITDKWVADNRLSVADAVTAFCLLTHAYQHALEGALMRHVASEKAKGIVVAGNLGNLGGAKFSRPS